MFTAVRHPVRSNAVKMSQHITTGLHWKLSCVWRRKLEHRVIVHWRHTGRQRHFLRLSRIGRFWRMTKFRTCSGWWFWRVQNWTSHEGIRELGRIQCRRVGPWERQWLRPATSSFWVLPSSWPVLVIRMILHVFYPQPFSLFHKRSLVCQT